MYPFFELTCRCKRALAVDYSSNVSCLDLITARNDSLAAGAVSTPNVNLALADSPACKFAVRIPRY